MLGFSEEIRAIVVGGTGGVGQAFVQALSESALVSNVIATSRRPQTAAGTEKLTWVHADTTDEATLIALAEHVKTVDFRPNFVINCSGVLHTDSFGPEKTWRHLDSATMQHVFAVNAFGVALLGKYLLPLFHRRGRSVFASISARVGSIDDNRSGGWYSYRASKAAHNMLLKTLSLEACRKYPELVCASIHPGTVDTRLSAPYTRRYDPNKLFSPEHSVQCMIQVLGELGPSDSGGFFAWDGQPIAF